MGGNGDDQDFAYEINEKGENVLVRSTNSRAAVFIRFINRTSRPVDVWWRDFQGHRRHYCRMHARTSFNVDTFVTHPWEFTDPSTKENYLINNKRIFRAPASLAGMQHRTSWIISVCIRPLRVTVMLTLAQRLQHPEVVPQLGLPRELQSDLQELINVVQHPPPPPNP